MSIGYACLAIAVPGSEMRTCILKNASEKSILFLIEHNLGALEKIIDYNIENHIKLFRISSDIIPFGSSAARDIPWTDYFASRLKRIGEKIQRSQMRVSMHPGQYTVLNSPIEDVVSRAIMDLEYHNSFLSSLGLNHTHKIILHIGGAYGDRKQSAERFIEVYKQLDLSIRQRLVFENDDRIFNISEVLSIALAVGAPVVFDTLHHAVNPPQEKRSEIEWIRECILTWREEDGLPKLHYSQQNPGKKPGAHTQTIGITAFICFYNSLNDTPVDIMLEVKDKNVSALKCICCTSGQNIRSLEEEWGRYKYLVLEKSPKIYLEIRKLLRDKTAYPAQEMYQMIESAMAQPFHPGHARNAAEHVWGYFKESATPAERNRYNKLIQEDPLDEKTAAAIKRNLLLQANKYNESYLLNSYYFYL